MASFSTSTTSAPPRTEFERQRGELIQEIAESFEHVLASINKFNRNLEAVITVGNEFSSVEALWSTFENVMGKPAAPTAPSEEKDQSGEGQAQQHKTKEGRESRTGGGGGGGNGEEL